jgi:hypothetical protein
VKLLGMKRMHTEGQKRGTRYFVGGKKRVARKPVRRIARKAKRVMCRPRPVAKRAVRKKAAKRVNRVTKRGARRRTSPQVYRHGRPSCLR